MYTPLLKQIQRILADAFAFFAANVYQIAALCLPFILTVVFFDLLLVAATDLSPVAVFARLAIEPLVYSIYMAALIHLMAARARQEQPQNADLIMRSIRQWAPFLALRMIELFLVMMGFYFLILPAIYFIVRLAFAEYHLALFNVSPPEAIKRSFQDTRKPFWLLLTMLMMLAIPVIMILSMFIGKNPEVLLTNDTLRITLNAATAVVEIFVRIVLFRAFMDVVAESR